MKKIYMIILLCLFILPVDIYAINEVNVYFFHDENCNICEQERVYLEALKRDRYSNMNIYKYDSNIYKDLLNKAKDMCGETKSGVPFTIIGDKCILGYDYTTKGLIQKYVYTYSKEKYNNKFGNMLGIGYRTDIGGEVYEYNKNENYTYEETSGLENKKVLDITGESTWRVYLFSIILISLGLILFILYFILRIKERKEDRKEFYE